MGATDQGVIGQSIRRNEDVRFLTGAGQYTLDVTFPHQACGYFLRSPHAHAKIRRIDTTKAKAAPGVVAIFTGEDLTGVNGLPCGWLITGSGGKPMNEPPHPVLAQGKVRHVGDQVALVIAETVHQAKDAAELVEIDYEVLPSVANCVDALKSGAPQIHDQAPGNRCYTWALDKVVAKGKKIAAHLVEAAESDIEFKDDKLTIAGTDRSKAFAVVSLAAVGVKRIDMPASPHRVWQAIQSARA